MKLANNHEIFPSWTPVQVAHHYNFPMDATGAGQTIAIIDLGESLDLEEVKKDFGYLRAHMPRIEVVQVGNIAAQEGSAAETHLDIEIVGCICPDALIKVYRAALAMDGMAAAIQRAVADDVDIISISWGGPERLFKQSVEDALCAAKKANITVCAAAGDRGYCAYPASSPLVLACGGTELMVDEQGLRSEAVWNNTALGGGRTGGGVSKCFELPDWQVNAGIAINSADDDDSTGRVIPDVAGLAARKDWQIGLNGVEELIGGTSAVAPLWASLVALINEKRAKQQKKRLGFLNENLYALAAKHNLFNDVTQGNNNSYQAKVGFDACTGWGTPQGGAVTTALVALE